MRGYLTYLSYRLMAALVGPLPPRAGYWLANRVGSLLYRVYPGLRNIVTDNMRHVLGPDADEAQVQTVAREACVNIAKGHYELVHMPRLGVDDIRNLVRLDGLEHMEAALARGRGVVAVTAHSGNVDIVGQAPVIHGLKVSGAVHHIQPERLFRYLLKIRQKHGLRLIPSDEPMIGLFRALKRNEIVALPCDRNVADHDREVEFFGAPTRLPDGPVRVALRTGAALLPVFVSRHPDNTFVIHIYPVLDVPRTGDVEADVEAGMKLVVAAMERHISSQPGQWLIAARVWPMDGHGAGAANGQGNRTTEQVRMRDHVD